MSANLSLKSIITRNNDLPSTDLEGEVGLMNMNTGKYYGLDPIGSRIWALLDKPVAVQELIGILLEEYEVDQASCEEEVVVFLEKLLVEGLITLT